MNDVQTSTSRTFQRRSSFFRCNVSITEPRGKYRIFVTQIGIMQTPGTVLRVCLVYQPSDAIHIVQKVNASPLVQLLVSHNDRLSLLAHVSEPNEEACANKSDENSISKEEFCRFASDVKDTANGSNNEVDE